MEEENFIGGGYQEYTINHSGTRNLEVRQRGRVNLPCAGAGKSQFFEWLAIFERRAYISLSVHHYSGVSW